MYNVYIYTHIYIHTPFAITLSVHHITCSMLLQLLIIDYMLCYYVYTMYILLLLYY